MNKLKIAREMIELMDAKQKDIASKIGVSTSNLSRILSGSVHIDKHFGKISEVFEGWRVDELSKLNLEIDKLNTISKKATKCLKY